MAEIQDTKETVIRLIQREKRRRDGKGRRYTPMSSAKKETDGQSEENIQK